MCPEMNKKSSPRSRSDSGPSATPTHLELFFFPECPYCRKVLNAIDELGLKERVVFRDARSDPKEKEALVELTGKTQVPCLVVDGKPMHESEDIKQYLHQTFGS